MSLAKGSLTGSTVILKKEGRVEMNRYLNGAFAGAIKHKRVSKDEEIEIQEEILQSLFPI